ncbi:MAG: ParB/RepB/Spo0J family partition protein [Planctomycetales bacterium]|jgi:ParB family chromosome partitioning protein|nr:ParB/RepB/Spo0J family partition protein [Planctomycetales bacterium]
MDDFGTQEPSRRRLGRGLNALLGMAPTGPSTEAEPGTSSNISVDLIDRNPFQPRHEFDPAALNELADSIRQHGVLQPVLVRSAGGGYQLIAGERRLIAAKKAGLQEIPCRVLALTDQQVSEVALEENLKRQDLNVLEKATAFQGYLDRYGCSIEELSRRLSLDRSTVSNMVRLLELPEAVKADLRSDKISAGHARALLSLKSDSDRVTLCDRIQKEGLSVRKIEEAVRDLNASLDDSVVSIKGKKPKSQTTIVELTPHVLSLRDQLRDWLGASVEITLAARDQGKIVIEFQSSDDFERIVGKLHRAA